MKYLKDNIDEIKQRAVKSAKKVNRDPNEIIIVGVTKTVQSNVIKEANKLGINDIGENKAQELCEKYSTINVDNNNKIKWHFIGHLQTNKVRHIIDKVDLIHSVDSYKLALEINKRARAIDKVMDVLVQVNIAEEMSKFGISIDKCDNLIKQLSDLPNIKVCGLMTMAPYSDHPEESRQYFRKLKKLSIDIKDKNYDNINMDNLSMGMTGDFEVAIEEGANIVRIGTALFGVR